MKILKHLFSILATGTLFCLLPCQGNAQIDSERLLKKPNEFVLYTMPKTGTHLLQPLLKRLTNKNPVWVGSLINTDYVFDEHMFTSKTYMPGTTLIHWFCAPVSLGQFSQHMTLAAGRGQFLSGHTPYSESMETFLNSRNCTVFFVVRDPRDYVVSLLHYLSKTPNEMFLEDWFYELDTPSQIAYIITGTSWYNSTARVVRDFSGWANSPVCCTLHFEKLLGERGGLYTKREQLLELRKIDRALKLRATDSELLSAFQSVYGKGKTFHKGVAGSWKDYFTPELKELFKIHANDLLIELGYEKNSNW
jgi:hypothetical protein